MFQSAIQLPSIRIEEIRDEIKGQLHVFNFMLSIDKRREKENEISTVLSGSDIKLHIKCGLGHFRSFFA